MGKLLEATELFLLQRAQHRLYLQPRERFDLVPDRFQLPQTDNIIIISSLLTYRF